MHKLSGGGYKVVTKLADWKCDQESRIINLFRIRKRATEGHHLNVRDAVYLAMSSSSSSGSSSNMLCSNALLVLVHIY